MNFKASMGLAVILGISAAGGLWWLAQDRPVGAFQEPPANGAPSRELAQLSAAGETDPALLDVLQRLESALTEQRLKTAALERELKALRAERDLPAVALSAASLSGEGQEEAADADVAARNVEGRADEQRRGSVNLERLLEAGVNPTDAAGIVAAVDQIALERLQLRYEAARDGTLNSGEFREAMAEIPSARDFVREEYGEDAYDSYLYASGRANRVVVTDVLQASAAQQVGLEAGDVLLSMNDQRVYSSRDIMAIASSSSGSVPITVRRNDQLLEYYVESGPLGIRSRRASENPAAPPAEE
ncbi:MAG: PDZ domain-containing protein [Pseudomonadota bacterium]